VITSLQLHFYMLPGQTLYQDKRSISDELLNVLATLVSQFVSERRCHQLGSKLSLSQTVILMKVVANSSRSTVQQIEFELSKAYLYRALRCKDSDSDSIYCLANVYLAVLYYTSGQYQTATDHCILAMRSQDHSQYSPHLVVQGYGLPKVDDDVDDVLGLAVFYQYVRMAVLNQQQSQHVAVFTTELFAHYLYIRCLSVMKCRRFTQMPSTDDVQRQIQCIIDTDQLFIADVLILRQAKTLSELKCRYKSLTDRRQRSTRNAAEQDTSKLVELLQQSAIKRLTTFRQLHAQKFRCIATIVTTDFEALYAYKRGDYRRCLQLSAQNVRTQFWNGTPAADVWTNTEFIQLMDNDIVSLIALTLIANPDCRDESSRNVGITQMDLSLYLMTQCQLKLHHSVTSLARTLDYIQVVQRKCPVYRTLERLTLKLTERKIMIYLSQIMQCWNAVGY